MTIVICKVNSGMCNRLMPFITSYRLAMNLNLKYYLCWDDNCMDTDYSYEGVKTKYNDMFYNIDKVNYILENEIKKLIDGKKNLVINYTNKNLNNYSSEDLLNFDVILFYDYVYPIHVKEDNIIFNNYGDIEWILNKSDYMKDIQKYFNLLKPVDIIQEKINDVLCKFPEDKNNIIGFHIRHWPGKWLINNYRNFVMGNSNKRTELMDNAIKENSSIKFFISTTDINIINELTKKYKDRIIYFEDRFGDSENDKYYKRNESECSGNIYKNLNGVVDLFLLSSCNLIIGDVASSYSISAPLLNEKSTYKQIKDTSSYY